MKSELRVKNATEAELLTYLANAVKTYFDCNTYAQRNKGEENRRLLNEYKSEFNCRDIEIPGTSDLLQIGLINGPGSY